MTDGELLSVLKEDKAGQTQYNAIEAVIRTHGRQPELYGGQAQCKDDRPPPAVVPSPDSQQSQQQCAKDVERPRARAERDHVDRLGDETPNGKPEHITGEVVRVQIAGGKLVGEERKSHASDDAEPAHLWQQNGSHVVDGHRDDGDKLEGVRLCERRLPVSQGGGTFIGVRQCRQFIASLFLTAPRGGTRILQYSRMLGRRLMVGQWPLEP